MLFHAFSREYGKVQAFYRPRKSAPEPDLGTVVRGFLSRNQNSNTLTDFDTVRQIHTQKLNFSQTTAVLQTLAFMGACLPE